MPDTPETPYRTASAEAPESPIAQAETPPAPEPLIVGAEPIQEWPAPATAPGDEDRVAKILHELSAITDVKSLETILGVVLTRCTSARVHPHVIQQHVAGALKSYDARNRDYVTEKPE